MLKVLTVEDVMIIIFLNLNLRFITKKLLHRNEYVTRMSLYYLPARCDTHPHIFTYHG